jgi:hypothetical protein
LLDQFGDRHRLGVDHFHGAPLPLTA